MIASSVRLVVDFHLRDTCRKFDALVNYDPYTNWARPSSAGGTGRGGNAPTDRKYSIELEDELRKVMSRPSPAQNSQGLKLD